MLAEVSFLLFSLGGRKAKREETSASRELKQKLASSPGFSLLVNFHFFDASFIHFINFIAAS